MQKYFLQIGCVVQGRTLPLTCLTAGHYRIDFATPIKTLSPMIETYRRLGEHLVEEGLVSRLELAAAIQAQGGTSHRLGRILIDRGLATEADIARCLARQLELELVDPRTARSTTEALALLPFETAWEHTILPVRLADGALECIVADPMDIDSTDRIAHATGRTMRLSVAPETTLREEIERAYGRRKATGRRRDPSAPTRYSSVIRRGADDHGTWFSAVDSILDRDILMSAVQIKSPRLDDYLALLRWTASMDHPAVGRIYDSRVHRLRRWTAFEIVHGEPLAIVVQRSTIRWGSEVVASLASLADAVAERPCGYLCPENLFARGSCLKLVAVTAPEALDDVTGLGDILGAAARVAGLCGPLLEELSARCRPGAHSRFESAEQVALALRQAERGRTLGSNTTAERSLLLQSGEEQEDSGLFDRLKRLGRRAA